jgi:hypothetical protein
MMTSLMYLPDSVRTLLDLVAGDVLNLDLLEAKIFSQEDLPKAMETAAQVSNLEYVVITP